MRQPYPKREILDPSEEPRLLVRGHSAEVLVEATKTVKGRFPPSKCRKNTAVLVGAWTGQQSEGGVACRSTIVTPQRLSKCRDDR